jgi:hypothetical protein
MGIEIEHEKSRKMATDSESVAIFIYLNSFVLLKKVY